MATTSLQFITPLRRQENLSSEKRNLFWSRPFHTELATIRQVISARGTEIKKKWKSGRSCFMISVTLSQDLRSTFWTKSWLRKKHTLKLENKLKKMHVRHSSLHQLSWNLTHRSCSPMSTRIYLLTWKSSGTTWKGTWRDTAATTGWRPWSMARNTCDGLYLI